MQKRGDIPPKQLPGLLSDEVVGACFDPDEKQVIEDRPMSSHTHFRLELCPIIVK